MQRNAVEPAICAVTRRRPNREGRPLTRLPPCAASVRETFTRVAASRRPETRNDAGDEHERGDEDDDRPVGREIEMLRARTGIANAPTSACAQLATATVSPPAARRENQAFGDHHPRQPRRPRAERGANADSRSRSTARASSRLATLKQASSSTSPMIPSRPPRPAGCALSSALPSRERAEPRGSPAMRLRPLARHVGRGCIEACLNLRRADTRRKAREQEEQSRVARREGRLQPNSARPPAAARLRARTTRSARETSSGRRRRR